MPWPDYGTAPQRPGRPLWQLVVVVVAVVAGSLGLLSRCAHAADATKSPRLPGISTRPMCSQASDHCARSSCVLRKIGGSWVMVCR